MKAEITTIIEEIVSIIKNQFQKENIDIPNFLFKGLSEKTIMEDKYK
jgi:hypothetical protein